MIDGWRKWKMGRGEFSTEAANNKNKWSEENPL
jgi:hypothetical protein